MDKEDMGGGGVHIHMYVIDAGATTAFQNGELSA